MRRPAAPERWQPAVARLLKECASVSLSVGFGHVPESRDWGIEDVVQLGACRCGDRELPKRCDDAFVKGHFLDAGGQLGLFVVIRRGGELLAGFLDGVDCWPAKPGAVTVGCYRVVAERVSQVGQRDVGGEDVPPAFGYRLLRGAAGADRLPVHGLD